MADDIDDLDSVPSPPGKNAAGHTLSDWMRERRIWLIVIALTVVQAIFSLVMLQLRSDAKPATEPKDAAIQAFAIDMLGHEVSIKQIHQLLPAQRGKRMTVGLDIVLVLGQLPEERVEGALRPTPEEFELFMTAIRDMEPRIRSQVNTLLQRVPNEEWGTVEVYKTIKREVMEYVNDSLDGLNFGPNLRKGIGKRRVTEVLLPMFVRQEFK